MTGTDHVDDPQPNHHEAPDAEQSGAVSHTPEQQSGSSADSSSNGPMMSFWDHLEELRWRVIKSLVAVIIGAGASLAFSNWIFDFLMRPVQVLLSGNPTFNVSLIALAPLDMIMVRLYIALIAGIIVGLPVLVYQGWAFISPGLHKHERGAVPWVLSSSMFLFTLGAAMAYFTIPFLLSVLVETGLTGVENSWSIREYISFLLGFMGAFGLVFQLPVVIYMLSVAGIVNPQMLRRYRRYAVVIIFVVAAFFTPSPDPFSQIGMALPLLVLFELSIYISAMVWNRRARRRLEEEMDEQATEDS